MQQSSKSTQIGGNVDTLELQIRDFWQAILEDAGAGNWSTAWGESQGSSKQNRRSAQNAQ